MSKVELTEMTPEIASERYIDLEKKYKDYGDLSKGTNNPKKKESYAKRRKNIRQEQNLLYKLIASGNYVSYTQRQLGLKDEQALYRRYRRFLGED